MPTAKVGTAYGVTIELTAAEASIEALGKQAMDLYREATAIATPEPGPAAGFTAERRWTTDHTDPNYKSNRGFSPVKADTRP